MLSFMCFFLTPLFKFKLFRPTDFLIIIFLQTVELEDALNKRKIELVNKIIGEAEERKRYSPSQYRPSQ